MPLGNWVRIAIAHRQTGTNNTPWYTTYQSFTTEPEYDYARAQAVMNAICGAEQQLYYNTVTIIGGVTSRFQVKTTVPDPTPPPYNPEDHTSITVDLVGARGTPSGDQLYYDQVIDFERQANFGNPGHIELRGALTEGEVDQTFSTRKLTTAAQTSWNTRLVTFVDALEAISADEPSIAFGFITQPQTSISWSIVNNKPRATRTYGAVSVRGIISWSLGRIRTDKGHAKYFDAAP